MISGSVTSAFTEIVRSSYDISTERATWLACGKILKDMAGQRLPGQPVTPPKSVDSLNDYVRTAAQSRH